MSNSAAALSIVKPKTAIEKRTRTTVDTIMLTPERIAKWKLPSGQRPLKENAKVKALVETIKQDSGVVPGIISLGVLDGSYWIIDGQHRLHAFLLSGLKEGYADARFLHAEGMADINREFVELNSKLVTMRPDDFLRGLEGSIPALSEIRRACPFVGYDQIRRGTFGPVVSMSAALRNWRGSGMDTPTSTTAGMSAVDLAESLHEEETRGLIDFLTLAHKAFGREPQYARLWTALNMVLCMWMFRKLVLTQYSPKTPRLTKDLFLKCLMSVSADSAYQDWLLGRHMGERDRSPAYSRLKAIFVKRIEVELGRRVQLPQPDWSN
jgi:hypothetical protein